MKIFNFVFCCINNILELNLWLLCYWLSQNSWRCEDLNAEKLNYGDTADFAGSRSYIRSQYTNKKWKICCSPFSESSGEISPDSLWEV